MLAATGTVAIMAARADVNIGLENYQPLALLAHGFPEHLIGRQAGLRAGVPLTFVPCECAADPAGAPVGVIDHAS